MRCYTATYVTQRTAEEPLKKLINRSQTSLLHKKPFCHESWLLPFSLFPFFWLFLIRIASPANFERASPLWINVAPNLPATPPCRRCERRRRARSGGGRQISHTPLGWKCEPSTAACSSHFLVPAAVFFLPPFNPDCGEVAVCRGDNLRYIVVTDFPYIRLLWYISQWVELSPGRTAKARMVWQSAYNQRLFLLWLSVKYQSIAEWHHRKQLVWIARHKKKLKHVGKNLAFCLIKSQGAAEAKTFP